MKTFWFSLALLCALLPCASAQNNPRIGYAYPAGGRQGASFQVKVGGQFLDTVTNVSFSGAGLRATVLEFNKPMSQKEFTLLRDKLKELQDKKLAASRETPRRARPGATRPSGRGAQAAAWTPADEKMLAEIRAKMLKNPPNRLGNPAIAETVTLHVTLEPDATPGAHELRLGTAFGLSNPLVFCVGQLPEFSEPPATSIRVPKTGLAARAGRNPSANTTAPDLRVTLPAVINGQILPGQVDRFRFSARRGQHLIAAVSARELIPYLADAVPGWFQAAVALFDAQGKELAYADHYSFHPDPLLHCEVPADGEYTLEIHDSIYRGREDFVYRLTVGELPVVTSLFPLGGPAGARTSLEVKGWNLPAAPLTSVTNPETPGIHPLLLPLGRPLSTPLPFAVGTLPEALEQEPNNLPGGAQPVSLPLILNGHIDPPGDGDVFGFTGRAGQEIVAEVRARRLNSPLDSVLKLTGPTGQQLALNDDFEDRGSGLNTHHADSYLRATLPADGTYYVHLGDAQRKGGPEYGYRLRLSEPRPDFELRVVPSSVNARPGSAVPITVYALRKDGFSNEITLTLREAPPGFSLSGGRLPPQQDQVRLTLSVPSQPLQDPLCLHLEGRALHQGQWLVRPGVPADDMMQAFAYRHLVPAQELKVAVTGHPGARMTPRLLSATPVRIPAGGTATVRLATPPRFAMDQFLLELSEPPEGLILEEVASTREGTRLLLRSDAAKVKPGLQGNLIAQMFANLPAAAGKPRPQGNKRPLTTLPAIPFEIVPQ